MGEMETMLNLFVASFSLLISSVGILAGILLNFTDIGIWLARQRGRSLKLSEHQIGLPLRPNPTVLTTLHKFGIEVVLGTLNNDLEKLTNDPTFASTWVQNNVIPHVQAGTSFRYITTGNEVIPGDLVSFVLPTMQNLNTALTDAKLNISISTVIATDVLGVLFPPSQGVFSEASSTDVTGIAGFLVSKKTPLFVNVYPYFAYANQPKDMQLNYVLFIANGTVVIDSS
uniref:Glucan endo-1,3-beta-glucosidase GVI n=1 Tax=Elaeis guineensis var. tenera TaxID=51953 RepID=A0A6I9QQB3_ELAGV|nr:putative glucan endo-1,3-beta-glucosidase GVI [Elaeis guineensis]